MDFTSLDEVQQLAGEEYLYIQQQQIEHAAFYNLGERISNLGNLPCFCKYMSEEQGKSKDQEYEIHLADGKTVEYPICQKQMFFSKTFGLITLIEYVLSTLIVLISYITRYAFIKLIALIRF